MKKIIYISLVVMGSLASCSSEDAIQPESPVTPVPVEPVVEHEGVIAVMPGFTSDTRLNVSDDLNSVLWSNGDQLGMYYEDAQNRASAAFTVVEGGKNSGTFQNTAFSLKPHSTYYAFFPYNVAHTISAATIDYLGQTQTANASAAHLASYNYMCGVAQTNSLGGADILFKGLNAVIRAELIVPSAGTFKSMTISSDKLPFIIRGTVNMKTGAIQTEQTASSITLSLGSGIALGANGTLTANMFIAPVNMAASTLKFTLTDTDGNSYDVSIAGRDMLAGKFYQYTGTLTFQSLNGWGDGDQYSGRAE